MCSGPIYPFNYNIFKCNIIISSVLFDACFAGVGFFFLCCFSFFLSHNRQISYVIFCVVVFWQRGLANPVDVLLCVTLYGCTCVNVVACMFNRCRVCSCVVSVFFLPRNRQISDAIFCIVTFGHFSFCVHCMHVVVCLFTCLFFLVT